MPQAPIDMERGLNKRNFTFTTDEIMKVAKSDYEQWIIRVPLLTFQTRRGPRGGRQDGFYDANESRDFPQRCKVSEIATILHTLQLNGKRLKYHPWRLREMAYERALYPSVFDTSEEYLENYRETLFKEPERDAITEFMIEHNAEDKIDQIFEVDVLKWTKEEGSDRITYFADEQKRLMGRRSVKTLASYLRMYLSDDVPDHLLRELHSKVLAMHDNDDRYEVHVAFNEQMIEDMFENTNFSSCMKRGEYIDIDLEEHPCIAYDSPDINMLGLYDTTLRCYVARAVTNANTLEYGAIYPNDGTGKRGMMANRLKQWMERAGMRNNYKALNGCRVKRLPTEDGYILPYVDGGSPHLVVQGELAMILEYEEDATDHGFTHGFPQYKVYGAQPTKGYVTSYDTSCMRDD